MSTDSNPSLGTRNEIGMERGSGRCASQSRKSAGKIQAADITSADAERAIATIAEALANRSANSPKALRAQRRAA